VTSFRGETAERRILETYNKKILVPYQNLSELNVQRFCESSGFVATFVFPSCVIFIWRNVTQSPKDASNGFTAPHKRRIFVDKKTCHEVKPIHLDIMKVWQKC